MVLPKALPISLEIVSLSLVQKLARKPSCHRNWHSGLPTPAIVATAHTVPAMPDPHTLEGPRLPPLFSAVPSSCFVLIFTLVAPVPWKKKGLTPSKQHTAMMDGSTKDFATKESRTQSCRDGLQQNVNCQDVTKAAALATLFWSCSDLGRGGSFLTRRK